MSFVYIVLMLSKQIFEEEEERNEFGFANSSSHGQNPTRGMGEICC